MALLRAVLVVVLCVQLTAASGKCKVSKVRAVCESRCEKDGRPVDRTSVPPPGTLMPPAGIYQGVDEGVSPASPPVDNPTPADASETRVTNLLELESETSAPVLTAEDVEGHISPIPILAWTDVSTASFGCVDGRTAEPTLGTWGGDIGEFITALNVYEQMASIRLSQLDVTNIFRKYLETSSRKKFTTCMSSLSIRQMFGSVEDLEDAIRNPAEEKQAALWLKIADPNFIGNDHLKLMLEKPSDYAVRKELVQHVIHSFYDILWNQYDPLREKLNIQLLNGDHEERGIVSITVPDFCIKQARLAPLIAPRSQSSSLAIANPDAVQVLRRDFSLFFSRGTLPVVRADEMTKRLNILAAGQGGLSKKVLYEHLPVYNARISE
eukprot:c3845_g1_i1.p1 GENE.c3845_g1_i1~~c3845_g1_i1.p1  ORF type:complete len:381 (-),score=96.83 c3845_g1_i1:140-1282(-)